MKKANVLYSQFHALPIISRQRVADYGEIFTTERGVKEMCDLVKKRGRTHQIPIPRTRRRVEILRRKLAVVSYRYAATQSEWNHHAVIAVSSFYGIDILADNVTLCRNHLYDTFLTAYQSLFPKTMKFACYRAMRYLLVANILWRDAQTVVLQSDSCLEEERNKRESPVGFR